MQSLVEKSVKSGIEVDAVIGDGAYFVKDNLEYATKNEIKLASKLSKSVTHGKKNKEDFEYNKDAGMYVCKAGNIKLMKE